jgi:hypothetical protein
MKVRPFIVDDALKTRIAQIEAYAREHPYIPGETIVPGDLPGHVFKTPFGYRAVFSYTRTPQGLYRDFSFGVDEPGKYPNEFVTFTLAQLFGFTGWDGKTISPPPVGWVLAKDPRWDAVRVVQELEDYE